MPSHDQQVDLIAGNIDGELAGPNQSEPLSRQTMNDDRRFSASIACPLTVWLTACVAVCRAQNR